MLSLSLSFVATWERENHNTLLLLNLLLTWERGATKNESNVGSQTLTTNCAKSIRFLTLGSFDLGNISLCMCVFLSLSQACKFL
jgi:hypothetical protein